MQPRHESLHLCRRYSCFCRAPIFSLGRTNVWAQEGSHRLGGARSSHTHRICKDFNNELLTPNHRDRSGVNKDLYICKLEQRARALIKADRRQELQPHIPSDIWWIYRSPSSTANMVKYFSVDWLAQSHHDTAPTEDHGAGMDTTPTCRPHIPCMVQPRPPTFGKSYLQPKPKASTPVKHAESNGQQDSNLCSPLHPTSCASPSKYTKNWELQTNNSALTQTRCLTGAFLFFSFRNQRVFLRVRERGGFLWVSLCGRGKRDGERRTTAPCAH